MDSLGSAELLRHYRDGSNSAAAELFHRYVQRLISLARSRISKKLQRRIDPEDVVQSAYRSFFLHAAEDRYHIDESGDLWKLLASITLHKLHRRVEQHTAARRHVDREEVAGSQAMFSAEPTPAEVIAALEQLSLICKKLTPEEEHFLEAYLQGQSIEQVAGQLQKSPRTVRRILAQLRNRFESDLRSPSEDLAEAASQLRLPGSYPSLSFENYTLEKLVGCGGMGKVYRATTKDSGNVVAFKTLHKARLVDARAVQGFLQEAQLLAGLRHPGIIAIDGVGRFPGGGYFLIMDFVGGGDLQDWIDRNGPLPVSKAIEYVRTIAEAIDFAHSHGIVHCDLKPANILMSERATPIVSDFGFAQLIAEDRSAQIRFVGGTRKYIAPEVQQGSRPSVAADIFSLGALLWTLATGSPHLEHCPASFMGSGERVEYICRRCVSAEPSQRFATAKALADELARLGEDR